MLCVNDVFSWLWHKSPVAEQVSRSTLFRSVKPANVKPLRKIFFNVVFSWRGEVATRLSRLNVPTSDRTSRLFEHGETRYLPIPQGKDQVHIFAQTTLRSDTLLCFPFLRKHKSDPDPSAR
jgi:hypothetical protein